MQQVGLEQKKAGKKAAVGEFKFYKILKIVQEADAEYLGGMTLNNPESVAKVIRDRIGDYANEVFGVLLLDTKNKLTGWGIIGQGSIDACQASPRSVFTPALLSGARALVLFHNHPTGDPAPSQADRKLTYSLTEAGKLLEVKILDHIIVGSSCDAFYSFASNGLI